MFKHLCRREFIKLGMGAALGFSPVINGCSSFFSESREEVEEIEWNANSRIAVPEYGCYAGFKIKNPEIPIQKQKRKNRGKKDLPRWFAKNTGKVPAVYSLHVNAGTNAQFPTSSCEILYRMGIIPMIRCNFYPDWDNVVFGNYDKAIERFASGARQFGKPFFITPWSEFNTKNEDKASTPMSGRRSTDFIQAWIHVHDIFKRKKASDYAVWGLQLTAYDDHFRFHSWDIADEFFDWIGFSIYNFVKSTGKDYAFEKLFDEAYEWARISHPAKPVALFGFGTSNTSSQVKWIEKAYRNMKEDYPAVKLAVYGFKEKQIGHGPDIDSTRLSADAQTAMQEILTDPYFIGSNSEYFKQTVSTSQKPE